ncbi:MAG: hypothetical protein NTW03_06355, partial [Verrucomicrobia bacterium]|nr:hypothetical protein [Verrucomicrobiota bacterium]
LLLEARDQFENLAGRGGWVLVFRLFRFRHKGRLEAVGSEVKVAESGSSLLLARGLRFLKLERGTHRRVGAEMHT